jgi:hypothetical protein
MAKTENIRWSEDDVRLVIHELKQMGKIKILNNIFWKRKITI